MGQKHCDCLSQLGKEHRREKLKVCMNQMTDTTINSPQEQPMIVTERVVNKEVKQMKSHRLENVL